MGSIHPKHRDYARSYQAWINSLSPEERQKAAEMGVSKPLNDDDAPHVAASSIEGWSFSGKHSQSEPDAMKLAVLAESSGGVEVILGRTPFDDLVEKEQGSATIQESLENALKSEAISGLLSFLFSMKSGNTPSPLDVCRRIYALCYCLRPSLIQGWSMKRIADGFSITKQAFSKEVIQLSKKLNVRSRNQKSAQAVSRYAENTEKWWAEKKQQEKEAARKLYLQNWREKNKERAAANPRRYYKKNKKRIQAQQAKRRGKKGK